MQNGFYIRFTYFDNDILIDILTEKYLQIVFEYPSDMPQKRWSSSNSSWTVTNLALAAQAAAATATTSTTLIRQLLSESLDLIQTTMRLQITSAVTGHERKTLISIVA